MTGVVEVDRLTRRFGSRRGVTDVTFGIDAGEVFGFLGPNGAASRRPSDCCSASIGQRPGGSGSSGWTRSVTRSPSMRGPATWPVTWRCTLASLGGSTWTGSVTPGVWTTPRTGTSS